MPHPPDAAAVLAASLRDAARGRARTAARLRASGPGALEEALLLVPPHRGFDGLGWA